MDEREVHSQIELIDECLVYITNITEILIVPSIWRRPVAGYCLRFKDWAANETSDI